jgi:hypothetical protein
MLLTTICNGFEGLSGFGPEFLLQANRKQKLIKIKRKRNFIAVTFLSVT